MARLLLATLALLAGLARAAHFKTECLYFSHQQQHEVMIYRPDASRAPPSHPYGKIYPEPNPTGLAYYKGDVLVAAYGNLGTIKPSIRRYTAATRLPRGYGRALTAAPTARRASPCTTRCSSSGAAAAAPTR